MQHHTSRQLRDARGRVARTPAVSPKKPAQVPAIAATFPNPRRCSRRLPSASKPPAHRSHLGRRVGLLCPLQGDPDTYPVQPAGGACGRAPLARLVVGSELLRRPQSSARSKMQGAGTSLPATFCALAPAAPYSSSRPLPEELGLRVAVLTITSRGRGATSNNPVIIVDK
ncbi:unnamed protein product [Urochloa humidicola]